MQEGGDGMRFLRRLFYTRRHARTDTSLAEAHLALRTFRNTMPGGWL